ncbi:unnamed protein product [Polarella glacialis]|uniref:Single-stranded DNA binding protein Ssb-like OB fold domain-containing protein n=1 Tax=Polarella glacialis TaxID=89957 RepID=A0A813EYT1_POLGL|nr:unnamed protein product [Polarella glacialis]
MASQSSTFVKVASIRPDSVHVNAIVKVLSCEAKLQCFVEGGDLSNASRFSRLVVGDETGTVMLQIGIQHHKLCDPGATVVLRGAHVETFCGQIRLGLGRWGRLTPVEDAAFVPNTSNDISAVDYALVAT